MWYGHGPGGMGNWGAAGWFGMGLMMLLVWLPLILVLVLAIRGILGPGGRSAGPVTDPAEDEARRSYARGEIDRERFLQVVRDLREHRPNSG